MGIDETWQNKLILHFFTLAYVHDGFIFPRYFSGENYPVQNVNDMS
jgi:hypothetical protein